MWVVPVLERFQVVAYLGAIAAALAAGLLAPQVFSGLGPAATPLLGALLYVTFLQVPAARLLDALRGGRFLAAVLVTDFLVAPLVVAALFGLVPDEMAVRIGVLMVLLCPCVDYVIVFAGLAGGDAARLLAATPVLLIVQMALLPVYLWLFLGGGVGDVVAAGPFLEAFAGLIVVPLLLAWLTQWWSSSGGAGRRVERVATAAMVPLMAAVLFVVVASQVPRLAGRLGTLAPVAGVYALFLVAMTALGAALGAFGGRRLGLTVPQRRSVLFSGVTRNSLVVLPLALALPGGLAATAAGVTVLQTLVELIGMVVLVRVVPRLVGGP